MTLKELHAHLGKLIADGASPDTPVAKLRGDWGGTLCREDDLPQLGKAWVADATSWGEPRQTWYFEDEVMPGHDSPDFGGSAGGVSAKEMTVLYL